MAIRPARKRKASAVLRRGLALERLQYPILPTASPTSRTSSCFARRKGVLLDTPFHVSVIAAALRDVGGDGEPDASSARTSRRR